MHIKTLEGLVGARTNINLINTPMRVFKDARRRGDMAVMERAMEYAGKFAGKAQEYKAEADEGMEEDAKEAKERAKLESEKAIQKRREEREKLEERMEESKAADTMADAADSPAGTAVTASLADADADTLEITEARKKLLGCTDLASPGSSMQAPAAIKAPVTYTKAAETVPANLSISISVSV